MKTNNKIFKNNKERVLYWAYLNRRRTMGKMIKELKYTCKKQVNTFVNKMVKEGLITIEKEETGSIRFYLA